MAMHAGGLLELPCSPSSALPERWRLLGRPGPLLVRVEGGPGIGLGHAMRCLALAQAWRDAAGEVNVLAVDEARVLRERLAAEGIGYIPLSETPGSPGDAEATIAAAKACGASLVVCDGYGFTAAYQSRLVDAGLRLCCVDDQAALERYDAAIVLNQNVFASDALYAGRLGPTTTLLAGARYAMLRREFLPWRGWTRTAAGTARRLLVTLGGSDPDGATLLVLRALKALARPDLETIVVVGPANPRAKEIEAASAGLAVRIEQGSERIPALLAWADCAMTAAGSTAWEAALLGAPSLVLILAENQRRNAETLAAQGAAESAGWWAAIQPDDLASRLGRLLDDPERRGAYVRAGQVMVDGLGAIRVARRLAPRWVRLRRAQADDAKLLWQWANDPDVRARAFRPEPIPWESHVRWFGERVQGPGLMLIGMDEADRPVGQVRIEPASGGDAEVDVSVGREWRGQGLGRVLIDLAVEECFETTTWQQLHAYIKPDNLGSQRAFEAAGFRSLGPATVKGHQATQWVRSRA